MLNNQKNNNFTLMSGNKFKNLKKIQFDYN